MLGSSSTSSSSCRRSSRKQLQEKQPEAGQLYAGCRKQEAERWSAAASGREAATHSLTCCNCNVFALRLIDSDVLVDKLLARHAL